MVFLVLRSDHSFRLGHSLYYRRKCKAQENGDVVLESEKEGRISETKGSIFLLAVYLCIILWKIDTAENERVNDEK